MVERSPEEIAKRKARQMVNAEVRYGRMPPPNDLPCVDCGHIFETDGKRHEYDHHRGYEPEHWLDVEAVCVKCHKKRDDPKANQTHCVNGHEFTPENTYLKGNGCRACRTCMADRDRRRGPRGSEHWRKVNAARKQRRLEKRSA